MLMLVLIFVSYFSGSIPATLAHLRGESISLSPGSFYLGDGLAGDERSVTVQMTNIGERPICIVGGASDCACIATGDLPVTIDPGQSKLIAVNVRFTGGKGLFTRRAWFYTDDKNQQLLVIRVSGRLTDNG
jgi:hypothetical protein